MITNYLKIGNIFFPILKGCKERKTIKSDTIFTVYKKPSYEKQVIYRNWEKFAKDFGIEQFSVRSHSVYAFSLHGYYNDNGTWYYIVIYPTKLCAYKVEV